MITKRKEEKWVYYAKAIGMILIVYAHAISKDEFDWIYINQFSMPLFFMLSGYFYKCKGTLLEFINKKLVSLYFPYVVTSFLMIVTMILIGQEEFNIFTIIKILLLQDRGPLLGAIWFLGVLFFALIAYDILNRILKNYIYEEKNIAIIVNVTSLILLIVGVTITFPYRISNICLAIAFICLGQNLKKYWKVIKVTNWVVVFSMFFIVGICSTFSTASFSTNTFTYKSLFIISAICGSLATCIACYKIFDVMKLSSKILEYVGKNTMGCVIFQFISFKAVMLIQILIYALPFEKINDFPVIFELNNFIWVSIYIISGVFLSILIYKPIEKGINYLYKKSIGKLFLLLK